MNKKTYSTIKIENSNDLPSIPTIHCCHYCYSQPVVLELESKNKRMWLKMRNRVLLFLITIILMVLLFENTNKQRLFLFSFVFSLLLSFEIFFPCAYIFLGICFLSLSGFLGVVKLNKA